MARTIDQIKTDLKQAFMQETTLQEKYGFAANADFDGTFSRFSIESILLYIIAASIWTLEKLFDTHTKEVTDYIATMKPHSLRWYVEKAKAFMYGVPLINGTDQHNTEGMTDEQIAQAKIVTFAACTEANATLYLNYIGITNENELNAGYGTCLMYNTTASTYPAAVKDGKVELSWLSDGYRQYLTMMNQWYAEGLVWQDFPTGVKGWITLNDAALSDFLGGKIAVAQMEMGDIAALPQQAHEGQSGMTLAALTCPVEKAGDKIHVKGAANNASVGWCLTTSCSDQNAVYALKLLDYLYSDEGALLSTFGIEGETYTMVNGVPTYTDLILKDPDGRAVKTMINIYCVDDMPQYVLPEKNSSLYTPEQLAVSDTWLSNLDGAWQYPGSRISLTADEAGRLGDLIGDLETYVNENMVKFIVGEKNPADDGQWSEFQSQITAMKGGDLTAILQAAYDRYLQR